MKLCIYTNNPLVAQRLENRYPVRYLADSYRDVLVRVRDAVHQGHCLYSHPLSGSVKPNETPYKSVAISEQAGALDQQSLEMIENSIVTCDKFPVKFPCPTAQMLEDFGLLDLTLMEQCLSQMSV